MPVPSTIDDLSTTASSNSPAGGETPKDGDNYIRALSAFIATLRDQLNGTSNTGTIKSATFSGTMAGAASWSGIQTFSAGLVSGYVSTPNVSAVIAYRSSSASLTAGTNTLVFDTETIDRASNFNNTTGVFTAPKDGVYQVNANVNLQNNSVSSITLSGVYISVGDSDAFPDITLLGTYDSVISAASDRFTVTASRLLSLSASDTVRVKVQHSGGNLTHSAGGVLSITYVG